MSREICEKIAGEIKNLDKGTVFTIKEFLEKYNVDKSLYLGLSVEIVNIIRGFAKIHEDDKGSISGLPYVFRYVKQ